MFLGPQGKRGIDPQTDHRPALASSFLAVGGGGFPSAAAGVAGGVGFSPPNEMLLLFPCSIVPKWL